MRRILRTIVLGTLLLSAFIVIGSAPRVLAASRTIHTPANSGYSPDYHPYHHYHHDDYRYNYRQGYQDGYSDCQQHNPPADSFDQGEGYSEGYNAGYEYCQSQQDEGHIQGHQDGYQDGYSTCQQEHSHTLYSKQTSPYHQAYSDSYKRAFRQGYNDCEATYNNGSSNYDSHSGGGNYSYQKSHSSNDSPYIKKH